MDEAGNLSLSEALELATTLHRGGRLREAEEVYRKILQAAPRQPDALHFLGVLSHQLGREEEAVRLIRESLVLAPDQPAARNNLGNVLRKQGRLAEAEEEYRAALRLAPDLADAWNNLGAVLRARGDLPGAVESYRRALGIDPHHADAHLNLGHALAAMGRPEEAAEAHRRALESKPDCADAWHTLCAVLRQAGRHEEAEAVLRQWLAYQPENPVARHLLAAGPGRAPPHRASDAYVRAQFDEFASYYDDRLSLLEYRGPGLVASALAREGLRPEGRLAVLDAGCGTGLCAGVLRPFAKRLVGVDLSPEMLERARDRGYDEREEAELTRYLEEHPRSFDLIVSADTLNYFGDLAPVLGAAAAALRPGGRLVFTLEHGGEDGPGYRLEPHGRYSHSETYVRRSLEEAGLEIAEIARDILRKEVGEPVHGLVIRARVPAS